jgi:hypothetical protein
MTRQHYQILLQGYDSTARRLLSGPEHFVVSGDVKLAIDDIAQQKNWPEALLLSVLLVEKPK